MTLLKFAVALLSTMVVAVDLSSKPDNSLAFAQLGKELSSEEMAFNSKVQGLSDDIDRLAEQICDSKKAASRAYKAACDNKKLGD